MRDSKNQIYKADELIFISKEEYLLSGRPVCNQNYFLFKRIMRMLQN